MEKKKSILQKKNWKIQDLHSITSHNFENQQFAIQETYQLSLLQLIALKVG